MFANRKAMWLVVLATLAAALSLAAPPRAMASAGAFWGGSIDPTSAPVATAQGTAADGTKIYIISKSSGLLAHTCRSIGTYKDVGAVICSDLYAQPDATAGKIDVYAIAEAYCQDNSVYPECASASGYFDLERSDGWSTPIAYYSCDVHTAGDTCSATYRNFFEQKQVIAAGACPELWTDLMGVDTGGTTTVELPGDVLEYAQSDLDTARAEIC